jgi:hypothetical protein
MKLTSKLTLSGVALTIGDVRPSVRKPDPTANQDNPRANCVYAHLDARPERFLDRARSRQESLVALSRSEAYRIKKVC